MKIFQNTTVWVIAGLVMMMALTRYNHFGSSVAMPDASYAVFFLGGLFLGRARGALILLALMLVEAVLIDYYAINYQGVSGWCVTSAYSFLMLAYAALWFIGRWYAPRHDLSMQGLLGLFAAGAAAASLAFVIANISFYLLAGYFGSMTAAEFASSVVQYYGSYIEMAVVYIGCAVIVQMLFSVLTGRVQRFTKSV
jgi:hypothetical protein